MDCEFEKLLKLYFCSQNNGKDNLNFVTDHLVKSSVYSNDIS